MRQFFMGVGLVVSVLVAMGAVFLLVKEFPGLIREIKIETM